MLQARSLEVICNINFPQPSSFSLLLCVCADIVFAAVAAGDGGVIVAVDFVL